MVWLHSNTVTTNDTSTQPLMHSCIMHEYYEQMFLAFCLKALFEPGNLFLGCSTLPACPCRCTLYTIFSVESAPSSTPPTDHQGVLVMPSSYLRSHLRNIRWSPIGALASLTCIVGRKLRSPLYFASSRIYCISFLVMRVFCDSRLLDGSCE